VRLYTLPDDTVIDLDKLSAVGSVADGHVLVDGKLIRARPNVDERRALLDAWRESGRRPMEELGDVSELAGDTADRLFALESDVKNLESRLDAFAQGRPA